MTDASTRAGSARVSRIIKAPRKTIDPAFLDAQALAVWLAPDSMRGRVHNFNPREGGLFRISLAYQHPADSQRGKTD